LEADAPVAPVGALQLYTVPAGIDPVGLKLNGTPVQDVILIRAAFAIGNTFTVTVKPAEVHPPGTFGVTKYVAVATEVPVLVNVPLKLLELLPATPGFNEPVIVGADQLKVVPVGTGVPVGVKLNNTPVQVVRDVDEILATGNTFTVTVKPADVHPPGTFGVTK
jgi:hypothetical protein